MKQEWKPWQNGDNCVGNAARLLPLFKPKGCNCKCQAAHFTPRAHDTSTSIANNPIYTPHRYNDILPVLRLESTTRVSTIRVRIGTIAQKFDRLCHDRSKYFSTRRIDNPFCVLLSCVSFEFFCFFSFFLHSQIFFC